MGRLLADLKVIARGIVLGAPLAVTIGAGLAIAQYPDTPAAVASEMRTTTVVIVPAQPETETETETMSRHARTEVPSTIAPTGGRRASTTETTPESDAERPTRTRAPEPTWEAPATTQLPPTSPLTAMPSSDTPIYDQLVTEHMTSEPLTSVFVTPN